MFYIAKANNTKKQFDREAQITASLRRNASLSTSSEIWDQTQPLVTASLRIMKPVCITANILLLTRTIFPLATGCWDHPEFAFGWNVVTVAKILFFAPLKYASADPSLSQAMSWSAVSLPAFSVLFLPYVTSKTLAQSICQILGGREVEWVGHNYHYTMQHTQLDTPHKKKHLDSDASKADLTKSKRGEFSKLEQHLFCQDMIQMARQWEIFGWALLLLVPLISWTDRGEKIFYKLLKGSYRTSIFNTKFGKASLYLKPPETQSLLLSFSWILTFVRIVA